MSALEGAFYSLCVFAIALIPVFFFQRKFARYDRERFERTNEYGVMEFESYDEARRFSSSVAATEGFYLLYRKVGGFIASIALVFFVCTSYAALH